MKLALTVAAFLFLSSGKSLQALEIVLDGSGKTAAGASSSSLGFLDMEKVFSTFPETRQAKEAFAQKVLEGKMEVKNREAEITQMRAEIALMKAVSAPATGQFLLPGTTAQVSSSQMSKAQVEKIADKEMQIGQKEIELKDFKEDLEKNLLSYEAGKSQQLMAKIYRVLEEIAQEEKITLIVDKNNILYGQGAWDLTDKVIAKLRQ